MLNISIAAVTTIDKIPFLPIEFFKTHQITSGTFTPSVVFKSSGTTNTGRSQHLVKEVSLYEHSFRQAFEHFYGPSEEWVILALLPSYLEQGDSSLVYMTQDLIDRNPHPESRFYLHEFERLHRQLQDLEKRGKKTLLLGVTYALVDFAEQYPQQLQHTIVMETGGMKGRKKELIRKELHQLLCRQLGTKNIHSEYGMTELLSQAYSRGNGIFNCPPWMNVFFRNITSPIYADLKLSKGIVNIIDLANVYSCSFIATQDLGRKSETGFEILGRTDHSDVRGCSQLFL